MNNLNNYKLFCGDASEILATMTSFSVSSTITSPPYYKRKDYSVKGQIGQESTVGMYVQKLTRILCEIYRITTNDGSCFFVIGDTYENRSLLLVPHRIALAASEIGWIIRNELIWSKLDPPPDSAKNRWRESHEHIFFLTKSRSEYKCRMDRIRVPYSENTVKRWGQGQIYGGRKAKKVAGPKGQRIKKGKIFKLNPLGVIPKDVICTSTACSNSNHYASFPESLIEQFLLAVTDPGDIVLDPFAGTSTTGLVALRNSRTFWGIDIKQEYIEESKKNLNNLQFKNKAKSSSS